MFYFSQNRYNKNHQIYLVLFLFPTIWTVFQSFPGNELNSFLNKIEITTIRKTAVLLVFLCFFSCVGRMEKSCPQSGLVCVDCGRDSFIVEKVKLSVLSPGAFEPEIPRTGPEIRQPRQRCFLIVEKVKLSVMSPGAFEPEFPQTGQEI